MRASFLLYGLFLAVIGVLLAVSRPHEDDIPISGARPGAVLDRVEQLAVDASAGLPAWRAAEARPLDAGTVLSIAGLPVGLALDGVEVDVGGGLTLRSARGELRPGRLHLEQAVGIDGPDGPLLTSAAAELDAAVIHFPGIVVLRPRTERERSLRDWSVDLSGLRDALAR